MQFKFQIQLEVPSVAIGERFGHASLPFSATWDHQVYWPQSVLSIAQTTSMNWCSHAVARVIDLTYNSTPLLLWRFFSTNRTRGSRMAR